MLRLGDWVGSARTVKVQLKPVGTESDASVPIYEWSFSVGGTDTQVSLTNLPVGVYTVRAFPATSGRWLRTEGKLLTEVPWVFAVPTGATKVTVYWDPLPGATGYRVRWGAQSGNYPFSSAYLPATPGTDVHRYTVTGLTSEVEYFFVVEAEYDGLWGPPSVEDSAVPHVGAIPWDTENPWQIINAVEAQLPPDMRANPWDDVWVLGPDGKIYTRLGVFPRDGEILPERNAILGRDGELYPLPVGSPVSSTGGLSLTLEPQAGPYRRVRSPDGYGGVSGRLYLPLSTQITRGSGSKDMPYTYVGSSRQRGEVDTGLAYNPEKLWWMPFIRIHPKQQETVDFYYPSRMLFPDASPREVDPDERRFLPGQWVSIRYWIARDVVSSFIAGRNMYWELTVVHLRAPNPHKTELARVKRVHSIAQVLSPGDSLSWQPTGSQIFGLEWDDGSYYRSGSWRRWINVSGTESGSYPTRGQRIGGVVIINWDETAPFWRERDINIQLPQQ